MEDLEELRQIQPIDIQEFREKVNHILDFKTQMICKILYLLAARASEITTKSSSYDVLHKKSKPLGGFLKYDFQDYTENGRKDKVLLLTAGVLKRTKVSKKDRQEALSLEEPKPEDVERAFLKYGMKDLLKDYKKGEVKIDPLLVAHLLGRIHIKVIALPCDPKYEPWTLDLLKYIQKHGRLSFDIMRQTVWNRITEEWRRVGYKGKIHPHVLRHWRISHLIEHYNFDPYDVSVYSGWSMKGTFGAMGIQASSNIDIYAHLQWKRYFPRLLIPIEEL